MTLALLAAVFVYVDTRALLRDAISLVEQLGPWGPVLFTLLYVVATLLFLPGSLLTLAAGAIFGVPKGSLLVSLASTLGATCAFFAGRYFAKDWVARKLAAYPAFAAIDRAVSEQGWKIVGLTRLSPAFPFSLLNYAFGITQVKPRDFIVASWIGMMPGTLLYVYLGSLARAGAAPTERTPVQWAFYALGLLATLAVTVSLTKIARAALARRTESTSPSHD